MRAEDIVREGRRLIERWLDLLIERDIVAAGRLLSSSAPDEMDRVCKAIHWYMWTGQGQYDWAEAWPKVLEKAGRDPSTLPLTRRAELPAPRDDYEIKVVPAAQKPPHSFMIDHAVPLGGKWTDLFMRFRGWVESDQVRIMIWSIEDMA